MTAFANRCKRDVANCERHAALGNRGPFDRSWSPKAAERNYERLAKPAEIKAQQQRLPPRYGQCDAISVRALMRANPWNFSVFWCDRIGFALE